MLKSPRIYVSSASVSIEGKFLFGVSRKLFWLGDRKIIPTTIGLVLGKRISKEIFSISSVKYCFWM